MKLDYYSRGVDVSRGFAQKGGTIIDSHLPNGGIIKRHLIFLLLQKHYSFSFIFLTELHSDFMVAATNLAVGNIEDMKKKRNKCSSQKRRKKYDPIIESEIRCPCREKRKGKRKKEKSKGI